MVKRIRGSWLFRYCDKPSTWSRFKTVKVSSTYLFHLRFASRIYYRLSLKFFHVDFGFNRRNRDSRSCSVLLFLNRPVILEIRVGVKFVRLARSLSFSSFRNEAWTASPIGTFVNKDSTSKDTMTSLSCTSSWLMVDMKCAELITEQPKLPVKGDRILARYADRS